RGRLAGRRRGPLHLHQVRRAGHPARHAPRGRSLDFMTTIPNFADVPLKDGAGAASRETWQKVAGPTEPLTWTAPEQIPVRPLYSAADLQGALHLDTLPGMPPFLRGPYPTMHVLRPWTVR